MEGRASVRIHLRRRRFVVLVLAAAALAAVGTAHGHEEDKGERIAAGLREAPAAYAPVNLELVGRIALGRDLEMSRPVATPQGDLLTADLYVVGSHAYVGSWAHVLHVVDIARPEQMREVARVPMPGPAIDVKIEGNLAVVGVQDRGSDFGVVIVDVADPGNPVILAGYAEPGWQGVHNLDVYEKRAYLAHSSSPGITILDISDPANPVVSGRWLSAELSNVVHDISIRDDIAMVSDFDDRNGGLELLSLDDPDNPESLAVVRFSTGLHSAWLEDGYIYCNQEFGGWEQRLHVVDARDPRQPELVYSFGAEGPPAIDILGPHNPMARDGLLYWAYYDAGLRVFDLTAPAEPLQVGYHPSPLAWGAHPHDDGLVYVADSIEGLLAFRFWAARATAVASAGEQPTIPALEQNHPNPFNRGTRIAYSLTAPGEVELEVFNLAGQRVACLVSGYAARGTHRINWDGTDDAGRELASGVYLYQLRQGERTELRRLLLLK